MDRKILSRVSNGSKSLKQLDNYRNDEMYISWYGVKVDAEKTIILMLNEIA